MEELEKIYEVYKLPEIKKENLTEIEYQHRVKYLKLYIRLIERCKIMTEEETSGYCEVHHILPRTMEGTDDKENLINMPVRYHIMAHIVLVEVFPEVDGLWYALWWMTSSGDVHIQKFRSEGLLKYSTRFLSKLREEAYLKLKVLVKSKERNEKLSKALTGRTIPKEVREKISRTLKGRKKKKLTDETKKKISKAKKGTVILPETREKISNALKGKKISEETRQKLSIANSGERNRMWGKQTPDDVKEKISKSLTNNPKTSKKVIGPDGTIYPSVSEAARQTGSSSGYISSVAQGKRGKRSKTKKWSYYIE